MLTISEARRKGVDACIDLLGRDFVQTWKAQSSAAWGMADDGVFCCVSVDTRKRCGNLIMLDSTSKWSHCAECKVSLNTGEITGLRRRTESEDCLDTADAKNPIHGVLV